MDTAALSQFKHYIVTPALSALGATYSSPAAINLLTGTALVESGCRYCRQLFDGVAVGLWQMEPATYTDCWTNYLNFNPDLADCVRGLMSPTTKLTELVQLTGNMFFACAMARVKYWRSPLAMPAADDARGLSGYHKDIYNSAMGAADAVANEPMFQMAIAA